MRSVIPVLFFVALMACHEPRPTAKAPAATDTTLPATAAAPEPETTEDALRYPGDTAYTARILTTGNFHGDEVADKDAQQTWTGIFKNDLGYYLSPTTVQLQRVNDPVLDEAGEKTGWEVATDRADSAILLMAGLDFLPEKPIPQILLPKDELQPGDSIAFDFAGVKYCLHATGSRVQRDGGMQVENYQLYLTALKNGRPVTELLCAQPNFDDNMVKILFAGDIDGDGQPDLLLDTSWHYNMTAPTLYLSKPAEAGHLLKVTAKHISVGC